MRPELKTWPKNVFAIFNSQWNSHWRGKVARGLAMALNLMTPKATTEDACQEVGIWSLVNTDHHNLHIVIAACMDGG